MQRAHSAPRSRTTSHRKVRRLSAARFVGGMFEDALRRAHPVAYATINAELNPRKYERESRDREVQRREAREDRSSRIAAERRELEEDRRLWGRVRSGE